MLGAGSVPSKVHISWDFDGSKDSAAYGMLLTVKINRTGHRVGFKVYASGKFSNGMQINSMLAPDGIQKYIRNKK